ncbi:glutamine amidotransferase-related protein [Legionella parisiensis]|uniref:Carbamoyl-phosphate synthase small chain n=1 Tax=Legionella parisiensis TaxID=45071 RepID=A0A1E5JLL5_9GAMM|nr:glutamine amidotransferase [Legionella parisiensis]KTD41642.1 glutamine amidotransferase, class I [Legionella parisiensis]OEH45447.1 Carbamoyl-phosphate synthase small chain [Legionella parisiensis]STX76040.1 glutamine amidotransferase, class I [Legionella parisiensis]
MKIGILQCDQVAPELITLHGTYSEMYIKLLYQVEPNLIFTVYDACHGELPAHIDVEDAYVITGSHHGVNDGYSWITALEEFIRCLHVGRKKVVGICFGHQLIAKALGGTVIQSPKGWGIGMSVNKITQHKSWMTPSLGVLNLIVSHQDQVVVLPPEAEVLAASDFCPFYMLQIRDNLFTVQGHPEYSKNYAQALIEIRKSKLSEELVEQGLKSLQQHCDDGVFSSWIVNFLSF